MDLAPVPLAQILKGRDGRQYEISGHAADIAQRLREIDPSLDVHVNEAGFFVVTQLCDAGGNSTTVETDTTQRRLVRRIPWEEWDGRVIQEFEARAYEVRHGISAAERLDALDAKREADTMYRFDQEVRERAGLLRRAIQRDTLNSNPRAFISKGLAT
jgi:hypothetical protein